MASHAPVEEARDSLIITSNSNIIITFSASFRTLLMHSVHSAVEVYTRICTSVVISSSPITLLACLLVGLTKRHDAPYRVCTKRHAAGLMRRASEGRMALQD